jgi:sugar phosphate isomerase/epimerase
MSSKSNKTSRRLFIKKTGISLASLSLIPEKIIGAPMFIPNIIKPNSTINGVQLGVITYSFREMTDQSAEAILEYILSCGINSIELMGDPAEIYAGRPGNNIDMKKFYQLIYKKEKSDLDRKELKELREQLKDNREQADKWRRYADLVKFEELGKLYKKAGVSIYAYKPNFILGPKNTNDEISFAMKAGKALGASHVTVELPKEDHSLRLGKIAEKNNIYVAYHGHEQQTPTWWDKALKQSPNNAINIDIGHYTAAGHNDTIDFLNKKHMHIKSIHVKDRKNPKNGKENVVWGTGDTPIKEVLRHMRDKKYKFPATVEYEYKTPSDSNIIKEIKKCLDYCKNALESKA